MLQSINNTIDDRLYELIIEEMNSEEQIQFVQNFQIYLEYGDNDKAFIINLDDIWKWIGFSRKDNAKSLLIKKFQEKINYIYNNSAPATTGALLKGNIDYSSTANNKEIILLNVSTFKKFCMKASTKRADEICDYYLKMERIMNQYTKEKLIEIQNIYKNTQKTLSKYIENGEDNIFWAENSISDYDNKNVIYIGYIGIINNEPVYKFGKSEQVYTREFEQHQKTFEIFKMKHIEVCDNMSFIEKEFKKELKTKNLTRILEINSKNQTELFITNSQNDINKIIQILKDLVIKYPSQIVKDSKEEIEKIKNIYEIDKLNLEIEYLKKENINLKAENEYFKNENNKIVKNFEELKQDFKEIKNEYKEYQIKYKNIKKKMLEYKFNKDNKSKNNLNDITSSNIIIEETIIQNNSNNIESNIEEENINIEVTENIDTNVKDEEKCKDSDEFCNKFLEVGENTSNESYKIRCRELFDLYNKYCLYPLGRQTFNSYISKKFNIDRKNCTWNYGENYQTWVGIKLKNQFSKESKLELYLRRFLELNCNIDDKLSIKTKTFHDNFKEYCNNNNFIATSLNGWSERKIRIVLEKKGFNVEKVNTNRSLYHGLSLK
jgi:hypothetical protein